MTLEIKHRINPVDTFSLHPVELSIERVVYINKVRAPKFIEKAILEYVDKNIEEYLDYVESLR